jgi:hypothetical protein
MGKDAAGLELEALEEMPVCPSKDAKDAVSNQDAKGIENYVVDVYNAERCAKYQRDGELNEFQHRADTRRQHKNMPGLDAGNEVDSKGEGKQNVFVNLPEALFDSTRVTVSEIEGDEVYAWLEFFIRYVNRERKDGNAHDLHQVQPKQ